LWKAHARVLADACVCLCLIRLSKNPDSAPGGTPAVSVQQAIKNPASSAGRIRPAGRTCSLLDHLFIRCS